MINYVGNFKPQEQVYVENLPVGAYIGKILGAKVESVKGNGREYERLVLQLDVTEGEHKDHYLKQYEASKNGQYGAKFKGVFRVNIPKAGDEYESMNKRILEGAVWCIEDSNNGYHWDWDESKLKGLAVGFSVREADWMMEDASGIRSGTTTEIGRLESINKIKEGKVKPMKKRELREDQKKRIKDLQTASELNMTLATEEELPF